MKKSYQSDIREPRGIVTVEIVGVGEENGNSELLWLLLGKWIGELFVDIIELELLNLLE
jgi:hypothetical protein